MVRFALAVHYLQPHHSSCSMKSMSIFSYIRKHVVISTVIVLVVVIVAIIAGRAASSVAPAINDSGAKQVTLVNIASFRRGNIAISADGVIEARSQADLRSQMSAPVSTIDVSLGGRVYQGQVILELQNADTRAQLAQAEASLALAQSQFSTGAVSLDSAKQNVLDKIRDAYIKTNDAITSQADTILYNNDGNGGRLTSYSTDAAMYSEITTADIDLRSGLVTWKNTIANLSSDSSTDIIQNAIKLATKNMSTADILLNDMSKILNDVSTYATPSFSVTVNAWKAAISGAHASLSGAAQSLTAAKMTLDTMISSQNGTANAQISVAQAGVRNLEAQLAKTIVRSPISGKVSALPLREGELASPGTLLATIIGNDSGIEIKAYVSGEDLARVAVGSSVIVQRRVSQSDMNASSTPIMGTVSNIAPGVDPLTKKAEVVIEIGDSVNSGLIIGQNVTVSILMSKDVSSSILQTKVPSGSQTITYLLPIQDVKIIPGAAYVFTVDASSKIVRNDVTLGAVRGDFIEVVKGLNDAMDIITPVYELEEGQTVVVE